MNEAASGCLSAGQQICDLCVPHPLVEPEDNGLPLATTQGGARGPELTVRRVALAVESCGFRSDRVDPR
jgi:hypothetical protein